jgi:murein DD-endopeptidase|tara:strand:- start:115 stop:594 length:480 start_codon:yes stop_codon:yes gene_type:complete
MALLKPVDDNFWNITSGFKPQGRKHPITGILLPHNGIDISLPINTPIYAVEEGTIKTVKVDPINGLYIKVDHGNNLISSYSHLQRSLVIPGQKVEQGDEIALSGNTGLSTGPHLHYALKKNGVFVDPAKESLYNINYKPIVSGLLIAVPLFVYFLKKQL